MIDDIMLWRVEADQWDLYEFDFDISHQTLLAVCKHVNIGFRESGSNFRVRKAWKSLEACISEDDE